MNKMIINRHKVEKAIDGIKYVKINGQEYTFYEVFSLDEEKDIVAFKDINAVAVNNFLYDYVVYDNETVERPFAEALDKDKDVKLFFKIPQKFKISTPFDNYSPDWAVYMETETEKNMYFVIETKGTDNIQVLHPSEKFKILCGKKHFEAIDSNLDFAVTTDWQKLKKEKVSYKCHINIIKLKDSMLDFMHKYLVATPVNNHLSKTS